MTPDYETIPFVGGHIDVGYTSHKQIQRVNGEVFETPVYDRAYLRIHARGDDGFLGTDMTPADAYALLKAVQRHCPHVEDQDMVRPEDEGLIRQAATLKPGETLIIRMPPETRLSQIDELAAFYNWQREIHDVDFKYLIVIGDELAVQQAPNLAAEAAEMERRLNEEIAKGGAE